MIFIKELSIFIDESGDFGTFEPHNPFYILTLVFHDQSIDITPNLKRLYDTMRQQGLPDYTVHAGPLIRRDDEYREMLIEDRKKIFNNLFHFVRMADITYKTIIVEKRNLDVDFGLVVKITKSLSRFLNEYLQTFMEYDRIVIYYDDGQRELRTIIISMFSSLLNNLEFKKPNPADYKLCQAADMFCTLELLEEKLKRKVLSKSEIAFFSSAKILNKSYLKAIHKKRFEYKNK